MDQANQMTLTFRCPPGLENILPPPIPAVQGLPEWFKSLPTANFNPTMSEEGETVKKCPPFIDAMTFGFLIPLPIEVKVANGEFTWDFRIPSGLLQRIFALADRVPRFQPDCRHAIFRRRPFHHQVQQFLDHRGAPGVLAAVYSSGQSRRPAVYDAHRSGRLRQILRQPGEFSGALARSRFQRRVADGDARGAVHAGETRELDRPSRSAVVGGNPAQCGNARSAKPRYRLLSAAIPRAQALKLRLSLSARAGSARPRLV